MSTEYIREQRKPLEDMDIIDDFLFTEIMTDKESGTELCRMILKCVLKREIGKIDFTPQLTVPGVTERAHGIRMDAYIEENRSDTDWRGPDINVYDIEPDNRIDKKAELPRRSRYYGDLIDVQLLNTGVNYAKLPELMTIFILSYDPFGAGAMYYEVGSIIKTHSDIEYNDGIRRIFLYVDGELPEGSGKEEKKLKNLLRYIADSTEHNVIDENTEILDRIVKQTKSKKDVGIRYMKSWERERELIEEGREEGREEERVNTERERQRADAAEVRADVAEARIKELEEMLKLGS